ncbi:nuclear transport factor 2 family protein [Rhodococcus koreensis]|uniref:nuclear transport factor 2 family protein n=1 Tax=Rhodococcus koreensis TaxID=99653 RepID=UPI0036DFA42F
MPDLTATLELLAAERDIDRALKLYCRGIDRRDGELVRSVYHDDAIDDHGGAFRGGPDAYVEWVMEHLLHFESTMHTLQNTLIDVDGDTARAESYCVAHHVRPTDSDELIMDVFGCRYIDRFENRPGAGWRIAHRIVVREWRLRQPMLSEAEQPRGFARSRRDRSDLSYMGRLPARGDDSGAGMLSRWWPASDLA